MTVEVIFKGVPYGTGTIIIYKEWPQWQKDMWYAVLGVPPIPLFKPEFEPQHTVTGLDGRSFVLNKYLFATRDSAEWLMNNFGATHLVSIPYTGVGVGGPENSNAREIWAVWPDGLAQNAGQLLKYYDLNPEVSASAARDEVIRILAAARTSLPFPTLPSISEARPAINRQLAPGPTNVPKKKSLDSCKN